MRPYRSTRRPAESSTEWAGCWWASPCCVRPPTEPCRPSWDCTATAASPSTNCCWRCWTPRPERFLTETESSSPSAEVHQRESKDCGVTSETGWDFKTAAQHLAAGFFMDSDSWKLYSADVLGPELSFCQCCSVVFILMQKSCEKQEIEETGKQQWKLYQCFFRDWGSRHSNTSL